MKKVEKLIKYMPSFSTKFYGGFIYDGEDIDLCNDVYDEKGYKLIIKQKIINNIVYTEITREEETTKKRKIKMKTKMEFNIRKGELLIYVQEQGYVIPETKMQTIPEIKEMLNFIEGGNKDENRRNEV